VIQGSDTWLFDQTVKSETKAAAIVERLSDTLFFTEADLVLLLMKTVLHVSCDSPKDSSFLGMIDAKSLKLIDSYELIQTLLLHARSSCSEPRFTIRVQSCVLQSHRAVQW